MAETPHDSVNPILGSKKRGKLRKGWHADAATKAAADRTRGRETAHKESRQKVLSLMGLQERSQALQQSRLSQMQSLGMNTLMSQLAATAGSLKGPGSASPVQYGKIRDDIKGGKWAKLLAGADSTEQLAKRIEKLHNGLFDVTELGGFQAGVTGPHSGPGSQHHGDPDTFDVNTTRHNNTSREARKLRKLYRALQNAGYDLDEAIPVEANSSGSGQHGHFSTQGPRL